MHHYLFGLINSVAEYFKEQIKIEVMEQSIDGVVGDIDVQYQILESESGKLSDAVKNSSTANYELTSQIAVFDKMINNL